MQCSVGMCCDLRAEDESSNLVLDTHPLLTLPCGAVHVLGVYATHQPTEVCLMTQLQQVSCQPQCLTVMQVTSTVLQVTSTVLRVMSTVMQVMSSVMQVMSTVMQVMSTVMQVMSTVMQVMSTVMQVMSTVMHVTSTVMQVMSTVMQVMHIACSRSMCDTGALTKAYATAHLKAKSKACVRAITK